MKNVKASNTKQRRCKVNPYGICTTCGKEDCPYIYCQSIDCTECLHNYTCPMCQGNCAHCKNVLLCKIYRC